jgi:predicted cation transporter
MPLHVRSIAANIAVISFFALSVVGSACGLSPFTCCKRAIIGSLAVYLATALAVKAVNAILISAMIRYRMNRQEEQNIDNGY